jgi:hypothetical protein
MLRMTYGLLQVQQVDGSNLDSDSHVEQGIRDG